MDTEYKLSGIPAEAAKCLAVSIPDKRKRRDLLYDPAGRFDINEHITGLGCMRIGSVTTDSYGVHVVNMRHKFGSGGFTLGHGRLTRAGMALRIACRLAGETIRRDELNGFTGEAQGSAWTGGVQNG